MPGTRASVLIVDDDPVVVDRYGSWLEDDYDVLTALDGETALGMADEADVVLLDRRLPDIAGSEVAARVFELESRPLVAMVSGMDPDTDILELPCDDYLSKPLTGERLEDAVERLSRRAEYSDVLARYSSLVAKRAAIESSQPMDELVRDPEYDELCRKCESTRRELDGIVQGFEAADFETAFKSPEFNVN